VAEVVVVGGGLAGLSAAFEAARRGHFVTVLEESGTIGGRGTSTEHKGRPLNSGPHLLFRGGPLHVLITKVSKLAVRGRRLNSQHFFRRDGGQWKQLAISSSAIRGAKVSAQSKLTLLKLRRSLKKGARKSPDATFESWINSQPSDVRDELRVWGRMSTWLGPEKGGSMEFHASRALHALWNRGMLDSDLGWADIVGRILAGLDRLGVELRSQAKISKITLNKSREVTGVIIEGGRIIKADFVILALPEKQATKILEESKIKSPPGERTPLDSTLLDLVLEGRFLRDGMMYDQQNDVFFLTRFDDDSQKFSTIVSAMALGDQNTRLDRIEKSLDETASGWREQVTLRRQTNNITLSSALPNCSRPSVDHFSQNHLLLAGDWIDSEFWLSDGAVDTGLRAGAMIQGRSA